MRTQQVQRLTESSLGSMFGCTGLFDICGDADLMSLSFAGVEPFLDWIGWMGTDLCEVRRSFINWVRPEYSTGSPTAGYVADPCAPANSVEFGTCEFLQDTFGRLRRAAPTRDVTRNQVRLCDVQPRYRLDGSPIRSEREFSQYLATEALIQDLKRMIVTGNDATPGMFDGLEALVKSGYTDFRGKRCASMDSIVIDWNGNTMAGGAGITWNGAAVGASYTFYDVLRAAIRRVWQRIRWAPALAAQRLRVGDMAIVLPDFLAQCLLDHYTCWSVCVGTQYNEANLNTLEGRQFRDTLNGGMFMAGRIYIDGFEIPLIAYDWELIKNATGTVGDIYVLVRGVGNMRTLYGEYLNMSSVPAGYPEASYFVTDAGKLLGWVEEDETCVKQTHEMQPRLVSWAPFTNIRFQDVRCTVPGGALSPDPTSSFFPETSFPVA